MEETEMNENPLQTNNIGNLEVESESGETQELTRCQKCRVLCGFESIFISLIVLGIGGGLFFTFLLYTAFQFRFSREGVWVFFVLGILSCLLVLSFIVRTCIAIQPKKEKKTGDEAEVEQEEKKETRLALALKVVIARYNDITDVNGKYYLTKMYAAEAFEHTQQVYSLTKIYLCLMPVEISSIVCAAYQHLGYFSYRFSRNMGQVDITRHLHGHILRCVSASIHLVILPDTCKY